MKKIREDLYTWSQFNEEKQLDFNGLYLKSEHKTIFIDPPPMSEADLQEVEFLGKPHRIYLTNKHHTRASATYRERWGSHIFIHDDDAPLMEIPVDGTFSDGELVDGEFEAIRIPDAKTPGECAFYWKKNGVLIVGDAMIGKPEGSLSMLPDEKFKDPQRARQGLSVLRGLDFEKLLVGDGFSIFSNAKLALTEFLNRVQGL
ncbi:MAG: hypothetical protein K8R69_08785 [Deltaproteobacteria bacterium]|nr:hypothetical protein [Deltaproteobacteria bacterium]